jgi:predicted nucleic acid-binding protein
VSPVALPRPLIVDASVATKWLLAEPDSGLAFALRARDLAAPALLGIEVANALWTATARGQVLPADALNLLDLFADAPVAVLGTDAALERRALEIALAVNHPVYDCLYLALAERTGRLLVTADARFLRALRATPYAAHAAALEDVAG